MLTFLRLRSLDPSQDVDATLTWGGVGWGGVGWGDANVHPTLHKDCDAASVGWGGMGR